MSKLLAFEKETIIRFDEDSPYAEVYTASARVARQLEKEGLTPYMQDDDSWHFRVHKSAVRIKEGRYSIFVGGQKKSSSSEQKVGV